MFGERSPQSPRRDGTTPYSPDGASGYQNERWSNGPVSEPMRDMASCNNSNAFSMSSRDMGGAYQGLLQPPTDVPTYGDFNPTFACGQSLNFLQSGEGQSQPWMYNPGPIKLPPRQPLAATPPCAPNACFQVPLPCGDGNQTRGPIYRAPAMSCDNRAFMDIYGNPNAEAMQPCGWQVPPPVESPCRDPYAAHRQSPELFPPTQSPPMICSPDPPQQWSQPYQGTREDKQLQSKLDCGGRNGLNVHAEEYFPRSWPNSCSPSPSEMRMTNDARYMPDASPRRDSCERDIPPPCGVPLRDECGNAPIPQRMTSPGNTESGSFEACYRQAVNRLCDKGQRSSYPDGEVNDFSPISLNMRSSDCHLQHQSQGPCGPTRKKCVQRSKSVPPYVPFCPEPPQRRDCESVAKVEERQEICNVLKKADSARDFEEAAAKAQEKIESQINEVLKTCPSRRAPCSRPAPCQEVIPDLPAKCPLKRDNEFDHAHDEVMTQMRKQVRDALPETLSCVPLPWNTEPRPTYNCVTSDTNCPPPVRGVCDTTIDKSSGACGTIPNPDFCQPAFQENDMQGRARNRLNDSRCARISPPRKLCGDINNINMSSNDPNSDPFAFPCLPLCPSPCPDVCSPPCPTIPPCGFMSTPQIDPCQFDLRTPALSQDPCQDLMSSCMPSSYRNSSAYPRGSSGCDDLLGGSEMGARRVYSMERFNNKAHSLHNIESMIPQPQTRPCSAPPPRDPCLDMRRADAAECFFSGLGQTPMMPDMTNRDCFSMDPSNKYQMSAQSMFQQQRPQYDPHEWSYMGSGMPCDMGSSQEKNFPGTFNRQHEIAKARASSPPRARRSNTQRDDSPTRMNAYYDREKSDYRTPCDRGREMSSYVGMDRSPCREKRYDYQQRSGSPCKDPASQYDQYQGASRMRDPGEYSRQSPGRKRHRDVELRYERCPSSSPKRDSCTMKSPPKLRDLTDNVHDDMKRSRHDDDVSCRPNVRRERPQGQDMSSYRDCQYQSQSQERSSSRGRRTQNPCSSYGTNDMGQSMDMRGTQPCPGQGEMRQSRHRRHEQQQMDPCSQAPRHKAKCKTPDRGGINILPVGKDACRIPSSFQQAADPCQKKASKKCRSPCADEADNMGTPDVSYAAWLRKKEEQEESCVPCVPIKAKEKKKKSSGSLECVTKKPECPEKQPPVKPAADKIDVSLNFESNTEAHFTSKYDLSDDDVLAIRRGSEFTMDLTFWKPYKEIKERVAFTFMMSGKCGIQKKVIMGTSENAAAEADKCLERNLWRATFDGMSEEDDKTISVSLNTYHKAPIGKWCVIVHPDCRCPDEQKYVKKEMFLLFNPWLKEDQVHVEDEKLRERSVLEEFEDIYTGTDQQMTTTPWFVGQFHRLALCSAFKLLDDYGLKHTDRDDVMNICKTVKHVINSCQGLLKGGLADSKALIPIAGSLSVLKARDDPLNGQCWVYAGLAVTLLRCLGIPSRVVTCYNFCEGYFKKGENITIHSKYKGNGEYVKEEMGRTWSFHCWPEFYMQQEGKGLDDDSETTGEWFAMDPYARRISNCIMDNRVTNESLFCPGPVTIASIREFKAACDDMNVEHFYRNLNGKIKHYILGGPKNNPKAQIATEDGSRVKLVTACFGSEEGENEEEGQDGDEKGLSPGKKQVDTRTSQKSLKDKTSQKSLKDGPSQKSLNKGASQKNLKTAGSQKSVREGSSQKNLKSGGASKTEVKGGASQKNLKGGPSLKSVKEKETKKGQKGGKSKKDAPSPEFKRKKSEVQEEDEKEEPLDLTPEYVAQTSRRGSIQMEDLSCPRSSGLSHTPWIHEVSAEIIPDEESKFGEDLKLIVRFKNLTSSDRNVTATMTITSMYYCGVMRETVKKGKWVFTLSAEQEADAEVIVTMEEYNRLTALVSSPYFRVNILGLYTGSDLKDVGVFTSQQYCIMQMPKLEITIHDKEQAIVESMTVGETYFIDVRFQNELEVPLTDGAITIEGNNDSRGCLPFNQRKIKLEPSEEEITVRIALCEIKPRYAGDFKAVCRFETAEMKGIIGEIVMPVEGEEEEEGEDDK